MKNLAIIACVSQDLGLGLAEELLWHIPEDMAFFKQTTIGKTVVMGRKTFASIGKPLPGRQNVVLSRSPVDNSDVKWCKSKQELDEYLQSLSEQKFIIGGASLYQMYLPEAEIIYLTEVDSIKPADTYFPEFDKSKFERTVLQTGESDGAKYEIVQYERKL